MSEESTGSAWPFLIHVSPSVHADQLLSDRSLQRLTNTVLLFGDSHASPAIRSGPVHYNWCFLDIFLCDSEGLQVFPHAVSRFLPTVRPCNCTGFHAGCACSNTLWFVEQLVSTYGVCACCVVVFICSSFRMSTVQLLTTRGRCATYTAAFIQRAVDVFPETLHIARNILKAAIFFPHI